MFNKFVKSNIVLTSILLFIIIFAIIQSIKPSFLYKMDGSIRQFGVGYKNKTIMPVWLLSILLGVICYLLVLAYITYPKLEY